MARIQHKNIVDSELHELKGAASALIGSVPVASGTGTTTFQKLGVSSLSGSLPTTTANLPIATDGAGGFKTLAASYGRFQTVQSSGYVTSALVTPQGMYLSGSGIKVSAAGYYWFSSDGQILIPAGGSTPVSLFTPSLYNVTGSTAVASFVSGIVYLDATSEYRMDSTSGFSLWKINV